MAPLGAASACIGHARAAAGVASLIKTVTAMVTGTIPPGTRCPHPHRLIESGDALLRLPANPERWPGGPRLAAVNGLVTTDATSGAHLVLRREPDTSAARGRRRRHSHVATQAPAASASASPAAAASAAATAHHNGPRPEPAGTPATRARARDREAPPAIFALCGAEATAIATTLDVLAGSSAELADTDMRDLARHLAAAAQRAAGRGAPLRVAVTATDPVELAAQARHAAQLLRHGPARQPRHGPAAAQQPGAAMWIEPGISISAGTSGQVTVVFPGLAGSAAEHTALLAASLGGLRVLDRFGIRPRSAVGYSFGEIAGLVWAGCLPAAEAARLAALQGQVLRGCVNRATAMARVTGDAAGLRRLLGSGGEHLDGHPPAGPLHVAAYETATSHLIAGPSGAIRVLTRRGADTGIAVEVLTVTGALHSPALARCAAPLRGVLAATPFAPPRRRLISTITGQPVTRADDVSDALAGQLTMPVLFAQAMAVAAADTDVLVIAGPDGDPAAPHTPSQPGSASLTAIATAASGVPAVQITHPAAAETIGALFAAGAINDLLPFLGTEPQNAGSPDPEPLTWTIPLARDGETPATGRVAACAGELASRLPPVGPQRHV
jgi:enediyne polyketide synthase